MLTFLYADSLVGTRASENAGKLRCYGLTQLTELYNCHFRQLPLSATATYQTASSLQYITVFSSAPRYCQIQKPNMSRLVLLHHIAL